MKRIIAIALSVLMMLTCCLPAFAAEKTIENPASAYAEYDKAKVAQNDADYIASLNYDQIAGLLLDWLDRKIAAVAEDFNAFTESVGVDLSITGVDSLIGMKDHVAELEGDFANLDTSALVTREGGDVNFFYGVFQFMADNAETFGKVFRWDDQVFDYGKVGEYIEANFAEGDAIRDFYDDYLVTGDIQDKFIREIAREMGYEVPETRAETFDEILNNGIKEALAPVLKDILTTEESKAAYDAFDLRTTDVYALVKAYVGLLQNDYKADFDSMLSSFLSALQGMIKVVTAGVNVDPPELTIGHESNNPYATYHPASTEMADYMPTIYANDQAKDTLDQYADAGLGIEVKRNSEMTEADAALVAGTAEAWGKYFKTKAVFDGETLMDLDIKLSDLEEAVIAALQENVNGKSGSMEMSGMTVAFNISDAQATFSYKAYQDEDSFAVQVKVESATAKVNITSPIQATVTADLLDPDSTTVELTGIYSMLNSFAQPLVINAIKTAVGDMFADPVFATIVMNNLSGEIEELAMLQNLVSYIDADAEYDYSLLDVMADYNEYDGVVGQVNHILYGLVDMIASDEGMAYLDLTDGGNEYLDENLQKICDKVSELLDVMKEYIDRDTFIALAESADISASFASEHGFNAGMIYDMDFSSVENALDCGIRVACDLLAEDDPDSIFYDFHMRVEELDTLDAIGAAAVDMILVKLTDAIDLDGWDYTYTAIDAGAVDAGTETAEDAILGKVTDILYYAATYAVDKINSAANGFIGDLNEDFGLNIGRFALSLGVERSDDWRDTLEALADRFIALTDGICIPAGTAKEQANLWDKLTTLADVLPMNTMFSNYTDLTAMNTAFFDKALDGELGDFLAYFEVKDDAVAGDVPVTFALINASDYIVDRFFPDTVQAELYTASETVQEEFTGCDSDQGIAARNMVSINARRANILPCLLDLIREVGLLPGFACDHTNTEPVNEVPSTCTVAGTAAGVRCVDCGAVISGCEALPLAAHSYTMLVETKAATCTEGGYKVYKCATCDLTETRDRVNATGHSYTVLVEEKAATCTEGGYKVYKCANCDATETRDRVNALGHDYQGGACTRCNTADPNYNPGGGDNGGGSSGNAFTNILANIRNFFQRIIDFFKGLFNR